MPHYNDELVDIVDDQDAIVGTAWRSQANGLRFKRCVLAFIVDNNNNMCIFRRAAHKKEVYNSP